MELKNNIYFVTDQSEIQNSSYTYKCVDFDFLLQSLPLLGDIVGVDTETEGFDPYTKKILSLQLGNNTTQFVIDWKFMNEDRLNYLKEYFNSDKLFIFQNAKFDLRYLYHYNLIPTNIFDTYLAEVVLNKGIENQRKSLDALCKKYLHLEMDKSVRGLIHKVGLNDTVIKYAATDVKYLEIIRDKQLMKIKELNLEEDINLENQFVKCLAYIEYCGIYLNKDKWKIKLERDKSNLKDKERELNNIILSNPKEFNKYINNQLDLFSTEFKTNINWDSPTQVVGLFKSIGVKTITKDKKTGIFKDSVDASILESQKNLHPIIPIYIEYKGLQKLVTTYGENFFQQINPVTGRIHTNFTQIMFSGRTSSGGKDKDNNLEFINMQNIPSDKETRECFEGQGNNVLIVSDYSGQESIILVNKSLEPKLLDFYNSGEDDLHSFVASQIYPELRSLSLKEIKKNYPDKRFVAKVANFAIVYGATPITISTQCKIPLEDAEYFYSTFMEKFAGLKNYFKKCHNQAIKDGYILIDKVTGSKCFIQYFDEFKENLKLLNSDFWTKYKIEKEKDSVVYNGSYKPLVKKVFSKKSEIERTSVNYTIQGTASRISKLAGIYLFNNIIDSNNFKKVLIPNFIHDEYVIETPSELSEQWSDITQKCMELAGKKWCQTISLKAEPKISKNWLK